MTSQYDYKKYAVLYVDDEVQALKYFTKAFSTDFRVRTAASAADARKMIDEEGDDIGVLITDQRMPAQTGTDLLEQVRSRRPEMVRILTTAYSDLTSAIEAVNMGGAFQYVTKPWKIPELRGTLLRAMEYFLVRKDRDRLLAEKLHVLQRLMVMDRVRGLAALAAAVECRLRNPLAAVRHYVDQAPIGRGKPFAPDDVSQLDLRKLARTEAEGLVQAVREVLRESLASEGEMEDGVSVGQLVRQYVNDVGQEKAEDGITFQIHEGTEVPAVKASSVMIRRLIEILAQRIGDMDGADRLITLRVSAAGAGGVRLQLSGDDSGWQNGQVASLYSAVIGKPVWPLGIDMDVLAAFFIVYHHGGEVVIRPLPPLGPGFDVTLAADPESADAIKPAELDVAWFDSVFSRVEEYDESVLL